MKQFAFIISAAIFMGFGLTSCNKSYKKLKDGTEYKRFHGKGKKIKNGEFYEMSVLVKYKDSVLYSTYANGVDAFQPYDTSAIPPDYKDLFKDLKVGDSIVVRISTDTLIKHNQAAPFMAKGQWIMQTYKIKQAFATEQEMAKVKEQQETAAQKSQLAKDDAAFQDYFKKNNINTSSLIKTSKGVYVQILKEGTGAQLDTTIFAKIYYKGSLLDGTVFDSSKTNEKGVKEPLTVNLTTDPTLGNNVIPGMVDGLLQLKVGTVANLYIPSSLGYGPQGAGEKIKPNSDLIFNVDVVGTETKAAAQAEMKKQQAEYEKMQQEQMKKAHADTTAGKK